MFSLSLFLLIIVIPFVTMPRDIRSNSVSPYFAVVRAVLTTMVALIAVMAMAKFTGNPLFEMYHDSVVRISEAILNDSGLRDMVGLTDVDDAEAKKSLIEFYDKIAMKMPGYLLLLTTIVCYFDYIILSRSQAKRQPVQLMPKFKEFSFPSSTVMAMVIMYFLAWFISKGGMEGGESIFLNINYLFDMVFCIQGASVIFMYFDLKRVPKAVPVILIIFLWNAYLLRELVVIIGIMDLIFGLKGFIVFKQQLKEQRKQDRNNGRR